EEKRPLQHGEAANQSGEHPADGADLQRVAPAQAPRQRAHRQRPHPMPRTKILIGSVAKLLSGASVVPTMPAVANNTVLLPHATACVTASTSRLPRAGGQPPAPAPTRSARGPDCMSH